jgi:hypothetical protein
MGEQYLLPAVTFVADPVTGGVSFPISPSPLLTRGNLWGMGLTSFRYGRLLPRRTTREGFSAYFNVQGINKLVRCGGDIARGDAATRVGSPLQNGIGHHDPCGQFVCGDRDGCGHLRQQGGRGRVGGLRPYRPSMCLANLGSPAQVTLWHKERAWGFAQVYTAGIFRHGGFCNGQRI